jgi:hypothetical protein
MAFWASWRFGLAALWVCWCLGFGSLLALGVCWRSDLAGMALGNCWCSGLAVALGWLALRCCLHSDFTGTLCLLVIGVGWCSGFAGALGLAGAWCLGLAGAQEFAGAQSLLVLRVCWRSGLLALGFSLLQR